jgi:2-polyprenyl-3-methyl-5-hydroxy-6-metoxy-1,4-benzoquinol methylase
MTMPKERSHWQEVTEMMEDRQITLGRHMAYWFLHSPRRALYYMSYYKFAAKMIGRKKRVLDVGCGEGMGTWLLAMECGFANGVDLDDDAIRVARGNWVDPRIEFACEDFLASAPGCWDAVVNFDVIEHILPENVARFWQAMADNLTPYGVVVVGTPNITGQMHASEVAKAGHVNLYGAERLETEMRRYFHHVFLFGANDEVIHTGYPPMAHYLLALGCKKRM